MVCKHTRLIFFFFQAAGKVVRTLNQTITVCHEFASHTTRFLFRAVTASTNTAGVLSLTIYKLLYPPSDYSKCRTLGSRNIKVLNVAKPQCMSLKGIPCRRTFLRASSHTARFHHPHKTVNSRKNTAICALRLLRRMAGLLCEI